MVKFTYDCQFRLLLGLGQLFEAGDAQFRIQLPTDVVESFGQQTQPILRRAVVARRRRRVVPGA